MRHSETTETQTLRNNRATDKARCTEVGQRWAVGTSIGAACVQLATCIGGGKVTGMGKGGRGSEIGGWGGEGGSWIRVRVR